MLHRPEGQFAIGDIDMDGIAGQVVAMQQHLRQRVLQVRRKNKGVSTLKLSLRVLTPLIAKGTDPFNSSLIPL
jgi:hypothetical protein